MAFELPKSLKPVVDFGIHVLVGSLAFLTVFGAAVVISGIVKLADGYVPRWAEIIAEYAEMVLYLTDLMCWALFILSEASKLARELWRGLKDE